MKQLAQEQLGSMLFGGEDFNYDELRLKIALGPMFYEKVSLYVYDSDSKESLKQVRAFFMASRRGTNANSKISKD